jgi:hypothetical protein
MLGSSKKHGDESHAWAPLNKGPWNDPTFSPSFWFITTCPIFSSRKIDALVLLFSTCTVCTLDVPCSFHHIERERDKWIRLVPAVAICPPPADKLFISHEEKYNSQFRMRAVPVPLQVTLLQCQHVCCLAGRARDPANSNVLDFVCFFGGNEPFWNIRMLKLNSNIIKKREKHFQR